MESIIVSGENRLRFTLLMFVSHQYDDPEIHYFFLDIDELEQAKTEIEAEKYNM